MTTAAALTYRAIARMLKPLLAARPGQQRPAGTLLSGLCTLSDDKLRLFDEQLGCRHAKAAASTRPNGQILKNALLAEPADGPCVIPFAPVPLRRCAHDKKSASVLP
ncbi:MAG: hypothetical protein HC868_05000 [Sphingomonadales bacterium]|nr:hypothetical protein [Sphingomonadales bacterium]